MTWRDKNGEPVFRQSRSEVWPLEFLDRPVERDEKKVVPIKRIMK